jgi:N-acetylglucosaminyldiphosphoundecaprenol N-acetyl-beta-D-mannosaminyltransferase
LRATLSRTSRAETQLKYMGIDFFEGAQDDLRRVLLDSSDRFRFVVTPNVDHVNILREDSIRGRQLRDGYDGADIVVCDSRVLELLARVRSIRLFTYPGADLVKDLVEDPAFAHVTIGVIGIGREGFEILRQRHPARPLRFVASPSHMDIGSPEFHAATEQAAAADWDILIIGLGAPKQEQFALALKQKRSSGAAICAGAAVDFLIGRQKRAPEIMRRLRIEWLFRLVNEPGRLWRRYILGAPKLLFLLVSGQDLTDGRPPK